MNRLARFALTIVCGLLFAARALAADANVEGSWEFTVQSTTGVTKPQLVLKQDGTNVSGAYKGSFGGTAVKGTVKGNALSLEMSFKRADGNSFPLTYTGVVEGKDTIKGSFALGKDGAGGKGTFSGRRVQ